MWNNYGNSQQFVGYPYPPFYHNFQPLTQFYPMMFNLDSYGVQMLPE